MFCLLTPMHPMLASAVSIMECSIAHQIQKFQSSVLVTLKWSAKNGSLVSFVVWCIFSTTAGNSRGKGCGWNGSGEWSSLTWTWIQTKSRAILAENSGKICQIPCCATVTLIQKREKEEKKGRRKRREVFLHLKIPLKANVGVDFISCLEIVP